MYAALWYYHSQDAQVIMQPPFQETTVRRGLHSPQPHAVNP